MKRRVFQPAVWFAGLLAFAGGAEVATAAPYYTTTYVGKRGVLGDVSYDRTGVLNRATGDYYPFDSGAKYLSYGESAALHLPQTTVGAGPSQLTFSMLGSQINEATGTVVGTIPDEGSHMDDHWSNDYYGYVKPDAHGAYSQFHSLTKWGDVGSYILLNSADQVLYGIVEYDGRPLYGHPSASYLADLKTGVEANLNDLVDPKFMASFARLNGLGIDASGNILAEAIGYYQDGSSGRSEGIYILSPPGVDPPTPVPEPSLLWLAAGAIGLAARARRRKTRGA